MRRPGQPRHARMASSAVRARTAAVTALAPNSTHTTRTRTNSTRLLRSTARSTALATPFLTHPSVSVHSGPPKALAGSVTVCGVNDAPKVMSTSNPAAAMRSATNRTRSALTLL